MSEVVYTLDQYNALCAAIAQGVTEIQYGDKRLTYRSLSEMLRIKKTMEDALGIKRASSKRYVKHTKGLQ